MFFGLHRTSSKRLDVAPRQVQRWFKVQEAVLHLVLVAQPSGPPTPGGWAAGTVAAEARENCTLLFVWHVAS